MATSLVESEKKQQSAVDAARDPTSSVTAQQAEDLVVNEAKKAGSVALQFDANATPAEKAAQARSVCCSVCFFFS